MALLFSQYIINGNITGDEEGRYTYIGAKGSTVIDYAVVNREAEEKMKRMRIKGWIESDHASIEVEIEKEEQGDEEKEKAEKKEIISWEKRDIKNTKKI